MSFVRRVMQRARRTLVAHLSPQQRQRISLALRATERVALRISGLPSAYQRWCRQVEPNAAALATLREQGLGARTPWHFSVVMPVYNPDLGQLVEAIESVRAQSWPHWTLCIANDGSSAPAVAALLDQYARNDERIRVLQHARNGGIAAASATALTLSDAPWVALLDQDDRLAPWALSLVARALDDAPDAGLLYSDEDKLSVDGVRHAPFFKPDWNPELLHGVNYLCHLLVIRRSLVDAVGGFRAGFDGAQDYDLALRCTAQLLPHQIVHIPAVLYHWRTAAGSTAANAAAKPYAHLAGLAALRARFAAEASVQVEDGVFATSYRLRRTLAEPPCVSILVPTRDGGARLQTCMERLLTLTAYPRIELLLIDNQSVDPLTLRAFSDLCARARPGLTVRRLSYDHPFNYSAINNFAAQQAQGELLLLLNDDVEVLHADWLTEMVAQLQSPGVGAVGAKLYYPDGRLQHGGVVLGIGGVAGHSHKYFSRAHRGDHGRLMLVQAVSAVTGACLLTRKRDFAAVGGLDAEQLAVAFNDVDYCLKLRARGLRTVWTPYAELIHHESASRGAEDTPEKRRRFAHEVGVMQQRWGAQLQDDPYYSPSLTLKAEDFSLRTPAPPYLQRRLARRGVAA